MNEVVAELRALNLDVPIPLELPNDDDLLSAEETLFLPLPQDFRDYLLMASDVVYGSLEPVTVADPQSHTFLPEVAAMAWERGLPRDLIPVCDVAEGYYAIDEGGIVMLWSEADGLSEDDTWDSIWHWVKAIWIAD